VKKKEWLEITRSLFRDRRGSLDQGKEKVNGRGRELKKKKKKQF